MDTALKSSSRLSNPDVSGGRGERLQFGDGMPRLLGGRFDSTLIYTTLALVVVGLMSVFTATAAMADYESGNSLMFLLKQSLFALMGFGALLFCSRMHFERWKQLARPLAVMSIGLLLLTMFVGKTANGSERWIPLLFGFQFQPSDVAKVAAVVLMAQATSHKNLLSGVFVINLILIGAMIALIYQQPNLSVAMILGIATIIILFVSSFPLRILVPSLLGIMFVVSKKVMETPYQKARIDGWLDPWNKSLQEGYNLIQSYYAVAAGGLFGVGLGNSIQKLAYLPFQHTDFIFSVICEEWGFIGAMIVVGLFGLLAARGFRIAERAASPFGRMLAFGLTLAIILQAAINICVTIGLMPVTGVTLPLISYGGTSMIVTLGMIGILLNISRYRKPAEAA